MAQRRKGGSRQPDLIPRAKQSTISLPDDHPMVVLTDTVDWTEMEARAEKIRAKKLKNARPDFKDETQVTLTANPGVDYGTVINVMDALRSDGTEDLFPEVHFGVAR